MPASLGLAPPGMEVPPPGMMGGLPPMDPTMGMGGMPMPGMGMPPPGMDPGMPLPTQLAMAPAPVPPGEPPEEEPLPGPVLKPWYRKPPRPKLADVQAEAENQKRDHAGRVNIAMEMTKRLAMDTYGYFRKDEEAIGNEQIQPARISALRDEHDMACAHIASMEWGVDALYREVIDKEESAAKEDCASYFFECEKRQHSRSGNGPLEWALADILQKYGMLVGFDAIDPADDECGLRMRLIDPATVFPIHEGNRGLSAVYRCYSATASQVVGDFGDVSGNVERKVKAMAKGNMNKFDPSYLGEVIEYWDRNWFMVVFDGKEIVCREHNYARVPFTITYGCFGQQAFTRTSSLTVVDGSTLIVSEGYPSTRSRADDLMRIAQPYLWRRVATHDMEEAVFGLFVTAFRRSINPPVIHKKSIVSQNMASKGIDSGEGGLTEAHEDDEFEPWPTITAPEIIQPLVGYMQQNRMTGMASAVLNGQMPGAQTSGSAMDISSAIGYERLNPLIMIIQQFLAERTEWRLELMRDWGAILGDEENLGTLTIPRRRPNARTGNAAAHKVTPKLLRQTGIRVKVELRRFNPATLSQIAMGLQILSSIGIVDKRTMIKIAGFTPDPDAVLQAIDFDQLDEVPEVKQEKTLRLFGRLRDQALLREDYESAIDLEQAMLFIGSMMETRMSIGQPALGPDGQRLKPLNGTGPGGMPAGQGLSLPGMGFPPGIMGGRPTG